MNEACEHSGKYFARFAKVPSFGIWNGRKFVAMASSIVIWNSPSPKSPIERFPGVGVPSSSHTVMHPAIENGRSTCVGTPPRHQRIKKGCDSCISVTRNLFPRNCAKAADCAFVEFFIVTPSSFQYVNSSNSSDAVAMSFRVQRASAFGLALPTETWALARPAGGVR